MELKISKKFVSIKWLGWSLRTEPMQMAIIFGFILLTTLASLWMPIYFATKALRSF
jgi:hypothetical protein